jgi:putative oxidoreductase
MMSRARQIELSFLLLRVIAGAMFMCHGLTKVFGWPVGHAVQSGSQLWIGGMIELVCGALIAVGLFARLAGLIASGLMAVAYFQYSWKLDVDGWKWLPGVNGGELSVLYCFLFLTIAASGPGRISIDHKRGRA